MLEPRPEVMDVGAGDFGHKGAATREGLAGVSMRVVFWVDISGVQEESIRLVDTSVV